MLLRSTSKEGSQEATQAMSSSAPSLLLQHALWHGYLWPLQSAGALRCALSSIHHVLSNPSMVRCAGVLQHSCCMLSVYEVDIFCTAFIPAACCVAWIPLTVAISRSTQVRSSTKNICWHVHVPLPVYTPFFLHPNSCRIMQEVRAQ